MADIVTITLPTYAVRYLREMCKRDREYISSFTDHTQSYSLAVEASYDSLNAIECSLPNEEK